jgi:hypothetical protein
VGNTVKQSSAYHLGLALWNFSSSLPGHDEAFESVGVQQARRPSITKTATRFVKEGSLSRVISLRVSWLHVLVVDNRGLHDAICSAEEPEESVAMWWKLMKQFANDLSVCMHSGEILSAQSSASLPAEAQETVLLHAALAQHIVVRFFIDLSGSFDLVASRLDPSAVSSKMWYEINDIVHRAMEWFTNIVMAIN